MGYLICRGSLPVSVLRNLNPLRTRVTTMIRAATNCSADYIPSPDSMVVIVAVLIDIGETTRAAHSIERSAIASRRKEHRKLIS